MTFDDPEGPRKHHSAGQRQAKVQESGLASSGTRKHQNKLMFYFLTQSYGLLGHMHVWATGSSLEQGWQFFSGKSQTVKISYTVTAPGLCCYGTNCAKSLQSCPTL